MALRLIAFLMALILLTPLIAADVPVDPNALKDPVAEARARALMKQIRCLVCQNQSIEDSNATIATSLRTLVRDRVAAGETDEQIKTYLVDRYGDWVMLKPPVDTRTFFLWASPVLLLLLGLIAVGASRFLSPATARPVPQDLSEEEEEELKKLLEKDN